MTTRFFCVLFYAIFFFNIKLSVFAVEYKISALAGLMQQPTSQYYHSIHGGVGEISSFSGKLALRYTYLERPRFTSAGFSEQEFGNFITAGTQAWVNSKKYLAINAQVGVGQMQGYIAANKDSEGEKADLPMRQYELRGIATLLEAELQFKMFNFALGHQAFIGLANNDQMKNYVAWPFNYYLGRLGFYL